MARTLARLRRAVRQKRRQPDAQWHRNLVGGYWDTLGKLQLDFLVAQGLERSARFLDVGCGSLRAGRHLVDYLDAGNYYGLDVNEELLDAGYERELTAEQRAKLPRDHLRVTTRFDADFGVLFDMAIAQSVFTHVSLNDIRLCFYRVARHMKVGGKFYVTISEGPPGFPLDGLLYENEERPTRYTERNPYWYWPSDLEWAAGFAPWRLRYVGDWGHPRDQHMVELERIP